jgi:hypothetical protein
MSGFTYTFPPGDRLHRCDDDSSDSEDSGPCLTREPVSSGLADFQFESVSEKAREYRLAAEATHPYIITHSNLTFDDIPTISGTVPIKRSFYLPRKGWEESGIITDKRWKEIKKIITQILRKYNIPFCLPETVGVFSVSIDPTDRETRLIFDIYCCLKEDKSGFVIEFRRPRGSYDTISSVIQEVRDQLESPKPDVDVDVDVDDLALGSSMQYDIPPIEQSRYQGAYFDFDSLIKPK